MSKNTTRKGLALGAGVALVASSFGFAPANAAGQDDKTFVSLSPRLGTEYTVLADQYFDLKSNVIDSLAGVGGKDLKFLVSDPLSNVFVDQSQVSTTPATNTITGIAYVDSGTVTTVTASGAAYAVGSTHYVFGLTSTAAEGTGGTADASTDLNGLRFARASGTTISNATLDFGADDSSISPTAGKSQDVAGLSSRDVIIYNNALDNDLFESATITTSIAGKTISGGRATDGTFVVNTETNANGSDRLLRLVSNSASTYSVVVTAWVDSNDNGLIDSTEYTSPERTVTFQKAGDVTAVTTLSPVVGDTTLAATVVTTPTLNGQQVLAQNGIFLNAKFTRSLSTSDVYSTGDLEGNTQSAAWDDDDKAWTVTVNTDADAASEENVASSAGSTPVTDAWADVVAPISGADNIDTMAISTTGVVSVLTVGEHKLRSGDKITFALASVAGDNSVDAAFSLADVTGATVTVTGVSTFTYSLAAGKTKPTTAIAALALKNDNDSYTVSTFGSGSTQGLVDRVGAETYTATAVIQTGSSTWTAISNVAENGVISAAATTGTISTAATTAIQGVTYATAAGSDAKILTGTKTVPVTISGFDVDGDALGAGRPIVVTLSSETGDAFSVNGNTSTATVLTDANGQATVSVTSAVGRVSSSVRVAAAIENAVSLNFDLIWEDQAFGLFDLSTTQDKLSSGTNTRAMTKLGSYSLQLGVMDQWFNASTSAAYRLKVTGEGATSQFITLVDGKATVTVTDTGVYGAVVETDVELQKASGSTYAIVGSAYNFDADVVSTFKVNLGANGSTLYGNAADTSVPVAAKALVELDKRLAAGVTPAYGSANTMVLNGSVVNAATSAARQGAIVTVTGPSNILFSSTDNLVAKRGSLTFLSAGSGLFEINAYSTTAQTDSVVTFTSNGVSSTIKVSFTGTGVGEGTSLVITAPAAVKPASTFQVSAKLTDAYGNPVDTAAGRVKVTYTGSGIVWGTLPTETDSTGSLSFAVLLGSNDSASAVVTVSYDQNGDGDYVDAKDLTTTSTTEITASGVAASTAKVNAGSFKGYVALYAKGYAGKRMSAKVGKDWVVVASLASDFERVVEFTGAGVDVAVRIYIDRVLMDTINLTTK